MDNYGSCTYIYIYGTPPKKTYADFNFTGIYSDFFYILAPILFRLNLRHQQWEN